jgi:hypothetical protein
MSSHKNSTCPGFAESAEVSRTKEDWLDELRREGVIGELLG